MPVEKVSMVVSGTDGLDPARALPNILSGAEYVSQQQAHPWIQVDMGAEQWVKKASFCKYILLP